MFEVSFYSSLFKSLNYLAEMVCLVALLAEIHSCY